MGWVPSNNSEQSSTEQHSTTNQGGSTDGSLSRRTFLQASAGATAGAVALGMGGSAAAHSGIVDNCGRLQAQDAHVCAEDGSQITLGGMSFFWSQWAGQYYTRDVVDYLVDDFGVDVVRAAYGVTESGPSNTVQEIRNVVEAAIDRGIYVIIDWHVHDAVPWKSEAKDFFGQMVRDYGNNPHVIYELWNEPKKQSTSTIKNYCQELADHIRYVENQQGYSHNLVVCGNKTWSQYPNSYSIDDPNAAYTFHGYFEDYNGAHLDQLKNNAQAAMDMGNAVFVTEFGASYSDHDNTDEAIRWCQDNNISMVAWSVNDKDEPWSIFESGTSGLTAIGQYYKQKIQNWPKPDTGGGGGSDDGGSTDPNKVCNGGTLSVNEDVILLDNQWDNPDATQCVWKNSDGSFGWDLDATGTSGICYPQALVGTKPWGKDTGVADFPIQCSNVDELVMETEATIDIANGEWDWAEEWWLMDSTEPLSDGESPAYEIMLVLDWGNGHGHGTPVAENLWTDRFGNTVDLWAHYNSGGTSADFYIFRIQGGTPSTKVDLGKINEYMINSEGVDPSLYMTGIELGNEYWGGAVGSNTVREFDVTINGTTYTSGSAIDIQPVDLPGTIEAEDYVTASDTTSGNEGGAYRSGDVDIEATSDPNGGEFNVGYIEPGEWLEYDVNVPTEGTFAFDARVASNDGGGSLHIEVDGSQVASTSFGATGGWQTWTTVDVGETSISSGSHTIRVVADSGGWNLNYLPVEQTSSGGGDDGTTATELPATIQAEDYTDANDTTSGNEGGAYRDGNVDIESTSDPNGGKYNVGWIAQGEWLEYDVSVPSETTFDIEARVASNNGGGAFHVDLDGSQVASTSFNATGGWQTWTTVSAGQVTVPSGTHTLRITADAADWNLNYFNFTESSSGDGSDDSTSGLSGTYWLENVYSGKALDVDSAGTTNGTNVRQWTSNGSAAQQWTIDEVSDGVYELSNVNSGKLLDVEGSSTSDGGNVHQWEDLDKQNQRWRIENVSGDTYRLIAKHSGKALDVEGPSTSDGANIHQWEYLETDSQHWMLHQV